MTMVQTPRKPIIQSTLTLDDFLALPETKPASEFIDGVIIQKPMPQGKHSAIQSELVPAINRTLRGIQAARAFSELCCSFGDRATVPDISVFTWDRIVCDESGDIANSFTIAVL